MPLQTQLMRFSRQGGYFFNAFSDVVFTKIALPSLYRQLCGNLVESAGVQWLYFAECWS
jgi:hypothetical protein